jgi:hypothetical protein
MIQPEALLCTLYCEHFLINKTHICSYRYCQICLYSVYHHVHKLKRLLTEFVVFKAILQVCVRGSQLPDQPSQLTVRQVRRGLVSLTWRLLAGPAPCIHSWTLERSTAGHPQVSTSCLLESADCGPSDARADQPSQLTVLNVRRGLVSLTCRLLAGPAPCIHTYALLPAILMVSYVSF